MKKTFLMLLLQLMTFWVIAVPNESIVKYTLTGKVTDENRNPLPGTSVILDQTLHISSTLSDGTFKFTGLKPGNYTLIVFYVGYERQEIPVNLDQDRYVEIALKFTSIMGEEVIVSATRASSRMPIAQTTLRREAIREQNSGFDIPYLLEMIPSVVATSESGTGIGNTAFRIRGTDMSRINVTINGIPLNDPESQSVFWVNMPDFANSVDNVQIQRGVGTSSNGAAAFGATVNFQTTTLTPEPYANVELLAGSFNTWKTSVKMGTGIINKHFSFEGRYSQLKSDGYIDRGNSDHRSMYLTGAWHTQRSIMRLNIIHGEEHTGITWEGVPGSLLDTDRQYNPAGEYTDGTGKTRYYNDEKDNYQQTHFQLIFSNQLTHSLTLNATLHSTLGEGYYEQYKQGKDVTDYGFDPMIVGVSETDLIRRKWLDNTFNGFTLSMSSSGKSLWAVFGGAINSYDGDHFGRILWASEDLGIQKDYEWYRNNGKKTDANTYLKATWQVNDAMTTFGDLQLRTINYRMSGPDDDLAELDQKHTWIFFNPKAGVRYQFLPGQEGFFSFGIANREPSRADLKDAMKEGHHDTPKPEKLIDYEMGYSFRSQLVALGITLYYMDYKDQLVLTGKVNDSGYPLMTNVPVSNRKGIEITLRIKPVYWFDWNISSTISSNKIKDYVEYVDLYDNENDWNYLGQQAIYLGTTNISFSPSLVASSQIRLEPVKGLGFTLTSKYVGKQYFDNSSSNERKINPYLVHNIKIDYRLKLKNSKNINLELIVNNLLNNMYETNAYVYYRAVFDNRSNDYLDDRYFPQAGVNFMGKLGFEF